MIKGHLLPYSHLKFAHTKWKSIVQPRDVVIDATCGNGHDTLFLARDTPCGKIYAMDIQPKAIENTTSLLHNYTQKIQFIQGCHSSFPEEILPKSIRLITYNLGYLPGGDKNKTTITETTLTSIQNAQELIMNGGLISITCYPGHPEGKVEQEKILDYVQTLDQEKWHCSFYKHKGRPHAPSLLICAR